MRGHPTPSIETADPLREAPRAKNRVAARRRLFATAAAVWLLTCWLRANPTGELSHHYTDHLRHMGESVAGGTRFRGLPRAV